MKKYTIIQLGLILLPSITNGATITSDNPTTILDKKWIRSLLNTITSNKNIPSQDASTGTNITIQSFTSSVSRSNTEYNKCGQETQTLYTNETIKNQLESLMDTSQLQLGNDCTVHSEDDSTVCDFAEYKDMMFSTCVAQGGQILDVDAEQVCEGDDSVGVLFRNIPFCVGASCDAFQIISAVNEMGKEDNGIEEGDDEEEKDDCRMKFSLTYNSCFENPDSIIVLEDQPDGYNFRKCKWLKKIPGRIKKYCKKKKSGNNVKNKGNSILASDLCPLTCARNNKFIRKTWKEKTYIKSCRWLYRQKEKRQKSLCSKRKGDSSAAVMCPHICGCTSS